MAKRRSLNARSLIVRGRMNERKAKKQAGSFYLTGYSTLGKVRRDKGFEKMNERKG